MTQLPPLGVTNLVGASFSAFSKHYLPLLLAAFIPILVVQLIANAMMPMIFEDFLANPADPTAMFGTSYFLFLAGTTIFSILHLGFLMIVAGQILQGNASNVGEAVMTVLKRGFVLVALTVVMYVCAALGFVLLIIPGIVLMAAWSLAMPAVIFEGKGFEALGYSAQLTKEYRWPIIGGMVLLFVAMAVVSLVIQYGLGIGIAAANQLDALLGQPIWIVAINAVIGAAFMTVMSLFTVLLYTRLKDIKEGGAAGAEDVFS